MLRLRSIFQAIKFQNQKSKRIVHNLRRGVKNAVNDDENISSSSSSEKKSLLPNIPIKLDSNQHIITFDKENYPEIETQSYSTPYQKHDDFKKLLGFSKLSEIATRKAIVKSAAKGLYYRDPLTLNVIQIDINTGQLVELKDTAPTSIDFYNATSRDANLYAKRDEFYLEPMEYSCTDNSRQVLRLMMSFSPGLFENRWFVQGSIDRMTNSSKYSFFTKPIIICHSVHTSG